MSSSMDEESDSHKINEVFSDSDDSAELDVSAISHIVRSRPAEVSASNYFRVFQNVAHVPEKLRLLRLPAAFGIQEVPYSQEKYSEAEELAQLAEKKRLSRAEALIRWRWKRDKDGNLIRDGTGKPVRESNARIVRWSDGTYQLYIGSENVIDLQLKDNTENHQYVASINKAENTETESEESFLQLQSHLDSRVVFVPKKLAPVPKEVMQQSSEGLNYLMNAPAKARSTKERRQRRGNHAVHSSGLSRDFITGNGYEDEEDDEGNLSKIKASAKRGDWNGMGLDGEEV